MSLMSILEKQREAKSTRRAQLEKIIADKTKEERELADILQEEAEAERAYQDRRAELEQLRVERGVYDADATCVPSTPAEIKTALKVLEAHERAYGGSTEVFSRAIWLIHDKAQDRVNAAKRRDRADARIRELEG